MREYILLTKPTILLLVMITGAASLVIEGSLVQKPLYFLLVLAGLALTGGSANAFNMYFEREIDARMTRTRSRRPLARGVIKPLSALIFAIMTGIAGVFIFALFFNLFAGVLAFGTIIFYAFFYTLWLKPNTRYNIVIGGAAGAMGPIIAWASATGSLELAPIVLFMIIFFWTPPHFWALALYFKKDYQMVNLPMLPLAIGDLKTRLQILLYTIMLVGISLGLYIVGAGLLYMIMAISLGALFVHRSIKILKSGSNEKAMGLFTYSIIYLFLLFSGIIIDTFWKVNF